METKTQTLEEKKKQREALDAEIQNFEKLNQNSILKEAGIESAKKTLADKVTQQLNTNNIKRGFYIQLLEVNNSVTIEELPINSSPDTGVVPIPVPPLVIDKYCSPAIVFPSDQ